MKLSSKAEYACLAIIELATAGTSVGPKRTRAIAEAHGIPKQFLAQILLRLKKAGLVHCARGALGGYRLARPAKEITVAEIIALHDRWPSQPGPSRASPLPSRQAFRATEQCSRCRTQGPRHGFGSRSDRSACSLRRLRVGRRDLLLFLENLRRPIEPSFGVARLWYGNNQRPCYLDLSHLSAWLKSRHGRCGPGVVPDARASRRAQAAHRGLPVTGARYWTASQTGSPAASSARPSSGRPWIIKYRWKREPTPSSGCFSA